MAASAGKRFANYLIDIIIFSIILVFLIMFLGPVFPSIARLPDMQQASFLDQLMMKFVYGLYISIMETLLKGKTIGKYITETRAVDEEGYPVNNQTAFARGLIRIIPFEEISALTLAFAPLSLLSPYPWHDRWSKSIVIDERKSTLPAKK